MRILRQWYEEAISRGWETCSFPRYVLKVRRRYEVMLGRKVLLSELGYLVTDIGLKKLEKELEGK